MRYRTQGGLVSGAGYTVDAYNASCSDASHHVSFSPIAFQIGTFKVMQDVVTPNYHRRVAAGEMIFNPMQIDTTTAEILGKSFIHSYLNSLSCTSPELHQTTDYSGSIVSSWANSSVEFSLLQSDDYTRIQKQVATQTWAARQQGQTNYFESLAELDKCFSMLGSPLENVRKFIDKFPNGSPKNKIRRYFKGGMAFYAFASSEWLRFRYGLTPLVADVRAGLKSAKTTYKAVEPIRHAARAHGSIEKYSSQLTTLVLGPRDAVTYQNTYKHQLSARGVHYDNYAPNRWTDLGLTFQNLVGLPYELLHFSFVYDWFGNVNDVIYANAPRINVDPLGGTMTTKETRRKVCSFVSYDDSNTDRVTSSSYGDSNYTERVRLKRVPLQNPALTIRTDFRLDHWRRALDSVALIQQLLGRIRFDRKVTEYRD